MPRAPASRAGADAGQIGDHHGGEADPLRRHVRDAEEFGMVGDKLITYVDQFGPDDFVREPYVWG